MDLLRVATYAAHVLAVVGLFVAGRRVPSLRRPAWAVLAWLLLSPMRGFGRDDGRALYHVAQAAEWADHALFALLVGASPRVALGLFAVLLGAGLALWPLPATALYALAQLATVGVCSWYLRREVKASRVPLPGHLVQLVLVVGEALTLIAPYGLALAHGTTAADEWDAARVVRFATWTALAVVSYLAWRSAPPLSFSAWPRLRPSGGRFERKRTVESSGGWQRQTESGSGGESGNGPVGTSPG